MALLESLSIDCLESPDAKTKSSPLPVFVWPLLPANEIVKQAAQTIAYAGYIEELAILGSSNLSILTHPVFSYYFPQVSPFKSFIPTQDLDLLLNIGRSKVQSHIPKDIDDIEDPHLIDCLLSLSPYQFLISFPSPISLKGNPSCWVCKSSLSNFNADLHISASFTHILGLPNIDSYLSHQPVSYLPIVTIKHHKYTQSKFELTWPTGGLQDLQDRRVRIPDLSTFFGSEPALGTLVHLLIFSKYAAIMPNATLDSNSIQTAQHQVSRLLKNLDSMDLAHLEKRLMGMIDNMAASFFNNRNAIGNFLSLLTLLGIPHNPQQILDRYDQIKNQVFDSQAKLANNILYTYNMFSDPHQGLDNFLPLENIVIPN